jgi:hypothetical protein
MSHNVFEGGFVMFKRYKGYIIGFIAGIIATVSTGAYATIGDKVEAIFAEFKFQINGKPVQLDQTPVVIDGSSYLPVKSISQALGYTVKYDADTRTIVLNSNSTISNNVTDNKIYYAFNDVYKQLIAKHNNDSSNYSLVSTVKNMKHVIVFNKFEYEADPNVNYFYDLKTDKEYFSEDFYLKFLKKDDLDGLTKYQINRETKSVIIAQ